MQNTIKAGVVKAGLAVLLLSLASGSAFADLYVGSTTGQFYSGTTSLGSTVDALTFTGLPFVTSGPTVTLGTFSLVDLFGNYDPYTFKLTVNFTQPSMGGSTFTADVSGNVSWGVGSATIDFNNGPVHIGPQGSGFYLSLNDVTVNNPALFTSLTGTLAANPEPASIVLTSAFLGGLIVLFRKKLRSC